MGYINRLPRGLLSFVDSKTQGVNPASLTEEVQAILDLEPFYRSIARYETFAATNSAATGSAYAISVAVPNDEVWLLHSATIRLLGNGATAATGLRVALNTFPVYSSPLFGVSNLVNITSGTTGFTLGVFEEFFQGVTFSRPFVMAPGWPIGVYLNGFAGPANIEAGFSIVFNRCQV